MGKTNVGYHIKKLNPIGKRMQIILTECECPFCHKSTKTVDVIKIREGVYQNSYYCRKDGSEWRGNLYDEGGNIIVSPASRFKKIFRKS